MSNEGGKVRLQRFLADAGVAARRVCEQMIEDGRVELNGRVVTRLPAFVEEGDAVSVDGRPIRPPARKVYIVLHKPAHTLVTSADEPGLDRRTVLDLVEHPLKPRLFPVGRLHYDATGLVILTNDGEFANLLTHPRYGVPKTYWAVVKGIVGDERLGEVDKSLRKRDRQSSRAAVGLNTGPEDARESRPHVAKSTRPAIRVVQSGEGKTLLEISMLEARNRQLEDVLRGLGSPVRKVTRVGVGPLKLKGLGPGQWRELTGAEVSQLRKSAGPGTGPARRAGGRRGRRPTQRPGRREPG